MKLHTKVALVAAALTLGISTAAVAGPHYGPEYTPAPPPHGKGHAKGHDHAKAYGFHCKGFSKKHVKGEQGTPFSRCVKSMAQADKNEHMPPGRACKEFSKKHVKGEQGTPFSRCVKGVAQMRKEQQNVAAASVV